MLAMLTPIIKGHITISDAITGEIIVDKDNAIHYENISEAMANALTNRQAGYIQKMVFGNGGTAVDTSGVVTYLPTRTSGLDSTLYNQTYDKIVDDTDPLNLDPTRNYLQVRHTSGALYSDIFVSCLLDYTEPSNQSAFDNSSTLQGQYVFDELGLLSSDEKLLTHVIFHPVQKALNRLIQIDYTLRIQSLTNLSNNL
jgi:hypothetical protein